MTTPVVELASPPRPPRRGGPVVVDSRFRGNDVDSSAGQGAARRGCNSYFLTGPHPGIPHPAGMPAGSGLHVS